MNPGVHLITIRKVRKTAAGEVSDRCTLLTIILVVEFFGVYLHFLYVLICLALSLFQVDLFQSITDLWVVHQKREDCFREKKQRILVAKAETEGYKKRIEELQDFINEGDTELSEYDEKIVRKYIKEIRVFDNRLQVFFKAGIDIDITRE